MVPDGFSEYIESLRIQKRMSCADVGSSVGLTGDAYRRWKTGKGTPPEPTYHRLKEALDMDDRFDDFFSSKATHNKSMSIVLRVGEKYSTRKTSASDAARDLEDEYHIKSSTIQNYATVYRFVVALDSVDNDLAAWIKHSPLVVYSDVLQLAKNNCHLDEVKSFKSQVEKSNMLHRRILNPPAPSSDNEFQNGVKHNTCNMRNAWDWKCNKCELWFTTCRQNDVSCPYCGGKDVRELSPNWFIVGDE
jgi:hypothetical protein